MTALTAARTSATVYSFAVAPGLTTKFGALFDILHREFDATLIAQAPDAHAEPRFNTPRETALAGGNVVFYIRTQRLSDTQITASLAAV